MSDFFRNLPEIVMRKLYGNLENREKLNLTIMLQRDGHGRVLQQAGVHKFKEEYSCFLCQASLLHSEFGLKSTKRDTLGFHWLYKQKGDDTERNVRLVEFERRKNTPEDMHSADHILEYFESQLSSVFSTHSMTELRRHIRFVHEPHHFLPPRYWAQFDLEIDLALAEMLNPNGVAIELLGLPGFDPHDAYLALTAEKSRLQQDAFHITNDLLTQMQTCHSIGGGYKQIYLQYGTDPTPRLWEHGRSIQALLSFIQIAEDYHVRRMESRQAPNQRTIGKYWILKFERPKYIYIKIF